MGRGFGKMENGGDGCRGGRKSKFSKMLGSVFPASGDQKRDISGSEAVKKSGSIPPGGVGRVWLPREPSGPWLLIMGQGPPAIVIAFLGTWGEVLKKWKMVEVGPEGVENRDFQKCLGVFFQRRGIKNTCF